MRQSKGNPKSTTFNVKERKEERKESGKKKVYISTK